MALPALTIWQAIAAPVHAASIRLAAETNAGDVAAVARLRKVCPDAEVVRAALMLAEARRKAVGKFGAARAAGLWADPQGVEMASAWAAGRYKAGRIARAVGTGARVLDLCCGIGGDSMAMVEAGLNVAPVDVDPARAWMAGRNAGVGSVCADVAEFDGEGAAVHIDPARRSESGSRSWRMDDLRPGVDVVTRLIERSGGGAVKLGPGVDAADVPEAWSAGGMELEYLSEAGRLTQAVAWTGRLSGREGIGRAATLLVGGESITLRGEGGDAPLGNVGRFVYEPDDSVERAGLLAELCRKVNAHMPHARVGLLSAETLIDSPWLSGFEVLANMPWHERRVKAALDERGAGIVEVKTRGKAVNPDQLQMSLRGSGDVPLVVFAQRFDRDLRAIIARRVPRTS